MGASENGVVKRRGMWWVIGLIAVMVVGRVFYLSEEEVFLWRSVFCYGSVGVYREATLKSIERELSRSGYEYRKIKPGVYKIVWRIGSLKMVGVIDLVGKRVEYRCYRWGVIPIRWKEWRWGIG